MVYDEMVGKGLSRPPIPPPDMPTLSAIPRGMGEGEGDAIGAKGGALPELFRQVFKLLDDISAAAPGQSEAIDKVMTRLRDVMVAIGNGGSVDNATAMPEDGGSSMMSGGPSAVR